MTERCGWCGTDPLYVAYHDDEWGRPETDSVRLFELLTLEGFQAGLSWITILRKREGFRAAFAGFDPHIIAGWGDAEVSRLAADPGIVRHRGKIEATVGNARAWIALEAGEGFSAFIWRHTGRPAGGARQHMSDVPAQTEVAVALSKALKKAGFRFCGPTTVYAFMQAGGMVNDHIAACHAFAPCAAAGQSTRIPGQPQR